VRIQVTQDEATTVVEDQKGMRTTSLWGAVEARPQFPVSAVNLKITNFRYGYR
jgi:hypothetical protein